MHRGDSFECQPKHKDLSEINLGGGESQRKMERNSMRDNGDGLS